MQPKNYKRGPKIQKLLYEKTKQKERDPRDCVVTCIFQLPSPCQSMRDEIAISWQDRMYIYTVCATSPKECLKEFFNRTATLLILTDFSSSRVYISQVFRFLRTLGGEKQIQKSARSFSTWKSNYSRLLKMRELVARYNRERKSISRGFFSPYFYFSL